MVERTDTLTQIFKAAADPNRRRILTLLVQYGPTRVTDLARHFDISLNSISKHIKVLESAGLVSRHTEWREHLIQAELDNLREIDDWFAKLRSVWELKLDKLEDIITKEPAND